MPTAPDLNAWTSEILFNSGDDFFAALIAGIENATERIDLEFYIFERDALGERILEALLKAAQRKVLIRLLVDGIGAQAFNLNWIKALASEGISVKIYHPLPWIFPLPSSHLVQFRKTRRFFTRFFRLNRRDHRKLCLIDSKTAWLGSMNVDARHLREFYGEKAWRDLGVQVQGEGITRLEDAFSYAWRRASGLRLSTFKSLENLFRRPIKHLSLFYSAAVRLNLGVQRRRIFYRELLDRISQSKTRIWLATPYFTPEIRLLRALKNAKKNGADIRILIPQQSDIFFMPWVMRSFYTQLLGAGVRIFEYRPAFMHAKIMILDHWMLVGSSNLNHRSLFHDLEVDIVLTIETSMRGLLARFETDFSVSDEIRTPFQREIPLYQRVLGRLFLFFKYWL